MLHNNKSQSILQWFNSLTTKDVTSLEQFSDGSHFYEIVISLQKFFLQGNKEGNLVETSIFSDTDIPCNEVEVEEEKTEECVSESENDDPFMIKESNDIDTQKKYEAIRKFIDDFYHLESSLLIDYRECQNGKGLELAKVAIFLLSALIQKLLSTKDEVVYNTTLLDPEIQENIRECLSLVLMEKDMGESQIKKSDLHRILSQPSNFKGTPVRRQPSYSNTDPNLSGGLKNMPKKRKERTSVIVYEDPQDSPLRNLLESPKIQHKAVIFKKESEIKKLRSALLNEENKVMDLTLENKNLNEELEKRRKELEFYKKELELQREAFCDLEEQNRLKAEELKDRKMEEERVKNLIDAQKEEIKESRDNNEALQEKIDDLKKKLQLDQEATASLIKENTILKDKIQTLELDDERKDGTIKILNEKITNLQNDLKNYQQMYQDFSVSDRRKDLRSPNVPEALSTIVYLDQRKKQSERKNQESVLDLEAEDDPVKQLAPQITKEMSQIKSPVVESSPVDHLYVRIHSLEGEVKIIKEKLEYYEPKFGPVPDDFFVGRDLNSFKNEFAIISASDDISELNNSHATKNDCKLDIQLLSNDSVDSQFSGTDSLFSTPKELAFAKISYDNSTLLSIIKQLEKKNCISPFMLKALKAKCDKIKDSCDFFTCLKDLLQALSHPAEPSITTRRSRSLAIKEVEANSLISKNKNLEQELQVWKQNVKSLQAKFSKKEGELKMTNKNLEASNTDLKKELEKLREELAVVKEKYINMEKLAEKKDRDVKKALVVYKKFVNNKKEKSALGCEDCGKLQRKIKELNTTCVNSEDQLTQLKSRNKALEMSEEQSKYEVEALQKQIRELKRKLFIETSAMTRNATNRYSAALHYSSKSKHEPLKKENPDFKKKEEKERTVINCDHNIRDRKKAYDKPSTSNSMLASRSIRNSFFQTADEDDFLNESSLAEIHNEGVQEDAYGENRLQEIRRRNTLCPPHLQSSYPLEIQDMTPSEKKYYVPEDSSFSLSRKSSLYQGSHKKHNSKSVESDSENWDVYNSFPVKKRKVVAKDCIPAPISKKPCRPSSSLAKTEPSTPLKRVTAYVKRQATFRTPSSVQRLMSMHRKNKIH